VGGSLSILGVILTVISLRNIYNLTSEISEQDSCKASLQSCQYMKSQAQDVVPLCKEGVFEDAISNPSKYDNFPLDLANNNDQDFENAGEEYLVRITTYGQASNCYYNIQSKFEALLVKKSLSLSDVKIMTVLYYDQVAKDTIVKLMVVSPYDVYVSNFPVLSELTQVASVSPEYSIIKVNDNDAEFGVLFYQVVENYIGSSPENQPTRFAGFKAEGKGGYWYYDALTGKNSKISELN